MHTPSNGFCAIRNGHIKSSIVQFALGALQAQWLLCCLYSINI